MSNDADALVEALTADEYEYVPVDELHEHPKNEEVYGEIDPGESFVDDIRRNGVETPLIVNDHADTDAEWGLPNTVIGGHRRLEAARRVGLNAVPVKWESYPEPLATRRLILNNLQRKKNDAQQAKEMLMLEETARETSQNRLEEAGGNNRLSPNLEKGDNKVHWAKEVADAVGASKNTVRYTTDVFRFADPDEYVHDDLQNPEKYDVDEEVRELARKKVEQMEAGEESAHSAYQDIKAAKNKLEKERDRQQRLAAFNEALEANDAVEFYNCVASDLTDHVDSVDYIITDPPYDEGAIEDWQELATISEELLEPGGLLAAYSGKYHLPAVHDALGSELEYYWQFIVNHAGAGARVWPRNVRTNYKPVLVYAKPPVEELDALAHDVVDGAGREKDDHDWQQATDEAVALIDQLTEPDDVILDPMCGSGTTGVAALEQDRRVILADKDADAVDTAKRRCNDVL
jgi:site-specific DNA-methyltransferase (adenine-specific)